MTNSCQWFDTYQSWSRVANNSTSTNKTRYFPEDFHLVWFGSPHSPKSYRDLRNFLHYKGRHGAGRTSTAWFIVDSGIAHTPMTPIHSQRNFNNGKLNLFRILLGVTVSVSTDLRMEASNMKSSALVGKQGLWGPKLCMFDQDSVQHFNIQGIGHPTFCWFIFHEIPSWPSCGFQTCCVHWKNTHLLNKHIHFLSINSIFVWVIPMCGWFFTWRCIDLNDDWINASIYSWSSPDFKSLLLVISPFVIWIPKFHTIPWSMFSGLDSVFWIHPQVFVSHSYSWWSRYYPHYWWLKQTISPKLWRHFSFGCSIACNFAG
jgi:hypothetical protein